MFVIDDINDGRDARFVSVDGRMEKEKFVGREDVNEFTARENSSQANNGTWLTFVCTGV